MTKQSCIDCRTADGDRDGIVIPRAQWLLINPDDGGVLCANCIVRRAKKLPDAINVTAFITFACDYADGKEHPYARASAWVDPNWVNVIGTNEENQMKKWNVRTEAGEQIKIEADLATVKDGSLQLFHGRSPDTTVIVAAFAPGRWSLVTSDSPSAASAE